MGGHEILQPLFNSPYFWTLLKNTFSISLYSLAAGFAPPIILALLLNHQRVQWFKKTVQTVSYAPHFISTVVLVGMLKLLLSPSTGIVNIVISKLGGTPIHFFARADLFPSLYVWSGIWQNVGWSAIIYLSAMAGVSEELCEAGAIDGMGRLGIAIHITLPAILPTIVLLWIMQVGNVLSAGFDQHLIIGNTITQRYWEVIDTYTYRYGVQNGYYSLGTAVSLMKSVIGFVLVLITNAIARKVGDVGLF